MDITNMSKKKVGDWKVPISPAKNQTDCNSHVTGQFSADPSGGFPTFDCSVNRKSLNRLASIWIHNFCDYMGR